MTSYWEDVTHRLEPLNVINRRHERLVSGAGGNSNNSSCSSNNNSVVVEVMENRKLTSGKLV